MLLIEDDLDPLVCVPGARAREPWIGGWSQGSRRPPGLLPLDLEFLYLAKGSNEVPWNIVDKEPLLYLELLTWEVWETFGSVGACLLSGVSQWYQGSQWSTYMMWYRNLLDDSHFCLPLTRMLASKILWSCLYACDFQRFHIQHTLCSQPLSLNDANPSVHITNKNDIWISYNLQQFHWQIRSAG